MSEINTNTLPESGASLLESTNLPYRDAQVETKIWINDALEHDSKNPFAKFQLRKLAKSVNLALWKDAAENNNELPTSFDWQAVQVGLKQRVKTEAEYNKKSQETAQVLEFDALTKWEWSLADQIESLKAA